MIVPIKPQEYYYTEEQSEKEFWDDLRFHSHRWIQLSEGYFQCSFCKIFHTSKTPTNIHPLCNKNQTLFQPMKPSKNFMRHCPNIPSPTFCDCEDGYCQVKKTPNP